MQALLEQLPSAPVQELLERASVLDNFYIPTRYANGHSSGASYEHYGPLQSQAALEHAHAILEFARARLAQAG